jgi:hypothetical protein
MNSWKLIVALITVTFLLISIFVLFRKIKSDKKVPYETLFEKKKRRVYLVKNNSFVGWLVLIFFLSVFSFVFLFKITLISYPLMGLIILVLMGANVLLLKKKYRIRDTQDISWITLIIGMGQLALVLWLNFIPVGAHYEEYRIDKIEQSETSDRVTITLENETYSEFWVLRSFDANKLPPGDTIVYHFTEGLLGFKIYKDHTAH